MKSDEANTEERKIVEVEQSLYNFKSSLTAQTVLLNNLMVSTPNSQYFKISSNSFIKFKIVHIDDIDKSKVEHSLAHDLKDLISKDVIIFFKDDK